MNIYVFQRADGSEWADYRLPEGAKVKRLIVATRVAEIEKISKEGGRVGALAERRLKEITSSSVQPQRELDAQVAQAVREHGFFARLKWLLSGK
jgi:Glu-tRNA(Gln) amidotransferase subunit E-like FAD-binding protein